MYAHDRKSKQTNKQNKVNYNSTIQRDSLLKTRFAALSSFSLHCGHSDHHTQYFLSHSFPLTMHFKEFPISTAHSL